MTVYRRTSVRVRVQLVAKFGHYGPVYKFGPHIIIIDKVPVSRICSYYFFMLQKIGAQLLIQADFLSIASMIDLTADERHHFLGKIDILKNRHLNPNFLKKNSTHYGRGGPRMLNESSRRKPG